MKQVISSLAVLLFVWNARAEKASTNFDEFFWNSLNTVVGAVASVDQSIIPLRDSGHIADMKVFHLNISSNATLGIRGFANVTIAPEIEFIFQKNEPEDQ